LTTQHALGHRTVVGVQHDAHRFALVGPTGGRGAGRGRCQQLREQRIFLTHGLVGHHRHLTIARYAHQRDDPAPLQEAQNALARALNHLLNIMLARSRRWVEHLTLAITIWGI
jgi:hypothetical protein